MRALGSVLVAAAVAVVFPSAAMVLGPAPRRPHAAPHTEPIATPNDNRVPAGHYVGDTLAVGLTLDSAAWHIAGDSNPAFTVAAFAEEGKAPTIPGPLLRVRAGTPIHVTVRNNFDDTLVVRGLTDRSPTVDSLLVLPHQTRDVVFSRAKPGTFQYWATLAAWQRKVPLPVPLRQHGLLRPRFDSQLAGAFVVDSAGKVPDDRIFVITMLVDQSPPIRLGRAGNPEREFVAINGRSWPHTERLRYAVGDSIHWRVVNASVQSHPMHLHGFYFRVESHTDGGSNVGETYAPEKRRMVVTEGIKFGDAIALTWSPDRPGNWIFHCHLASHVAPMARIDDSTDMGSPDMHAHGDPDQHALTGMNGLVLGITVTNGVTQAGHAFRPARRLRLFVQSDSTAGDSARRWGYVLQRGGEPRRDSVESPGPVLLLTRGEPTSIRVTNRTPQPTSVHWHGIEIESYYDGVAGWSGRAGATEPAIRPESTFEVHITPKRAGTFMYHTHFNDMTQQYGGLVGPLVVLEPGQRWDAAHEIVVLVSDGRHGIPVIDGSASPAARELRVGSTYRIRVGDLAIFQANLLARVARQPSDLAYRDTSLVTWRAVAKDGFTLPTAQATVRPASERVASGETADFELTPTVPGDLRLEIGTASLTGSFRLYATMPLHVVAR